jgi:hypothetical protein
VNSAHSNLVRFCLFCAARNTIYFRLRCCTIKVYIITHMYIFFQKNKTSKCSFLNFQNKGLQWAWAPKTFLDEVLVFRGCDQMRIIHFKLTCAIVSNASHATYSPNLLCDTQNFSKRHWSTRLEFALLHSNFSKKTLLHSIAKGECQARVGSAPRLVNATRLFMGIAHSWPFECGKYSF